jgi:hypothetical protein
LPRRSLRRLWPAPGVVLEGWADEVDLLVDVAKNEVAATYVGGVRQLEGGQHPVRRKPPLDGRKLFYVGGGGCSCVDVRDQMRRSLVAALRKVHFVANPAHRTLGSVAGLHLVGGCAERLQASLLGREPVSVHRLSRSTVPRFDAVARPQQALFEEMGRVRSIELLEKVHAIVGGYRLLRYCVLASLPLGNRWSSTRRP